MDGSQKRWTEKVRVPQGQHTTVVMEAVSSQEQRSWLKLLRLRIIETPGQRVSVSESVVDLNAIVVILNS